MRTGKGRGAAAGPMRPLHAPRQARRLDLAIVLLAIASVLLFAFSTSGALPELWRTALTWADLAIVAAYAVIFVLKGLLDERPARWFRRHAWLAVALLPVTIPLLVAQPFFILVQVAILVARCVKAIDRALHLHVVAGLTERYRARLAEELSQPILLTLASALEESVLRRDFAAALGEGLRARRDLFEAAIRHGVESTPRLARFTALPPVRRFVDETTRDVVDAAHGALTSPQMNEVIRDAFRDAFRELRAGIEEPKWPHKGVSASEAAARVLHGRPDTPAPPHPAL